MQFGITLVNGFVFAVGFIIAAFVMKFLFHVSIMG